MRERKLRNGSVAYFFEPPTVFRRAGCPVHAHPLGVHYGPACERAKMLNEQLDAWRLGRREIYVETAEDIYGTLSWLFKSYRNSSAFKKRVSKRSEYEYRRATDRIEDMVTKSGRRVGDMPLSAIDARIVDRVYDRLQIGPRGKRLRQANLSVDIARRAWTVVQRLAPHTVPAHNPWIGVLRDLNRKTKPAATREEAYALAEKLREIGEPHLGAAALICFEWHQRPEHVLAGEITWTDYRPTHRPVSVLIRHPKTGAQAWLPLEALDERGERVVLFPELEAYLSKLPRLAVAIVVTSGKRGPARPYSAEYAQRRVREARKLAKLGSHVTLDACRHGGLTELGDAGVTEFEGMSLSQHKTASAMRLYVKKTERQRLSGAMKRRTLVEGTKSRT